MIYKFRDKRAKPEWQGFMNHIQAEHWFITEKKHLLVNEKRRCRDG